MRPRADHYSQRIMISAAFLTTGWGVTAALLSVLALLLAPLRLLAGLARAASGEAPPESAPVDPALLLWNAECVVLGAVTAAAGWVMVRGMARERWALFRRAAATALPLWVAWGVVTIWSPIPWIAESERWLIATPAIAAATTFYALVLSRAEG